MEKEQMVKVIRKQYAETVKALHKAEKEYEKDTRSVRKRETYRWTEAQEMALSDLCAELEIELYDDDLQLI
jgi:hypothetical protein